MADKKVNVIVELVDKASAGLKGMATSVEESGKSFLNLGNIITGFIGTVIIGGLVNGLKESYAAFEEQRKVAAQTEATLKSTGNAAGVTSEQVSELASALESQTNYSDDSIQSAENLLLTFTKINKDIFPETTELVLDMSTALGQDLKSSAIQIGKALQDPINGVTALRRVGVAFTESQQEQIKALVESGRAMEAQRMILAELKTEFGGSAKALVDPISQMQNALNNLQENIGASVSPTIKGLAGELTALLNSINSVIESSKKESNKKLNDLLKLDDKELKEDIERYKAMIADLVEKNKSIFTFSKGTNFKLIAQYRDEVALLTQAIKIHADERAKAAKKAAEADRVIVQSGLTTEEKRQKASAETLKKILQDAEHAKSEKTRIGEEGLEEELQILEKGLKNKALNDEDHKALEIKRNNVQKAILQDRVSFDSKALDSMLKNDQISTAEKIRLIELELSVGRKSADDQLKLNNDLRELKSKQLKAESDEIMQTLDSELDSEKYTAEQKIEIRKAFTKFRVLDADDQIKNEQETAKAEQKIAEDHHKKLVELGRGFATDFQGTLKKMVDDSLFAEGGAVQGLEDSLKGMVGDAAPVIAGAVGGIAGTLVGQLVTTIFGGTSETKNLARAGMDAFDEMVEVTNDRIQDLGRTKSEADKSFDVLKKLEETLGKDAVIPETFLKALGVSSGTTVGEGQKIVTQRQLSATSNLNQEAIAQAEQARSMLSATQKFRSGKLGIENYSADEIAELAKLIKVDTAAYEAGRAKDFYISLSRARGGIGEETYASILKEYEDKAYAAKVGSLPSLDAISEYIDLKKQEAELVGAAPAFATGGIVGGNSQYGDRVMIRANSDEMVLTKPQQAQLWNFIQNGVQMARGGQRQEVVLMLDRQVLGRAIVDLTNLNNAGLL